MVSLLAMLLSLSLTMLPIEFMIRVNGPEELRMELHYLASAGMGREILER